MTRQDLVVFGDSHIGAIVHVRDHMPAKFSETFDLKGEFCWVDNGMIAYSFTQRTPDGLVEFNPIMLMYFERYGVYDRWIEEWSREKPTLVFLTGFAESHIVSWKHDWQGYALTREGSSNGGQVISVDLVRDTIRSRLTPYFDGLALLCEKGCDVFQVAGPPPHRSVEGLALSPEGRLAVYGLIVGLFEEFAERAGFRFIRSDFLADADGFLRAEFENDGVHVNSEGALAVLDCLNKHCEGVGREGGSARIGCWPPRDFLGAGWHDVESWGCWSKERAQIVFSIAEDQRIGGLTLSFTGPVSAAAPTRCARILLHKREIGVLTVTLESPSCSVEIDGSSLVTGRNVIVVVSDGTVRPSDLDKASLDHRTLGVGLTGLEFRGA